MSEELLSPSEIAPAASRLGEVLRALDGALLGRERLHRLMLAAILARGHVLLEGLPGLGKTALVHCLGRLLELEFKRVQFTPDLLPGDILGAHILQETGGGRRDLAFQAGPVFTNLLLADEINRASPKTQSALLEAMQERQVTLLGEVRPLPHPFFVLATQNPIELEGTYPLPEAQLDRFLFKLELPNSPEWVLERIVAERHRGELPDLSPLLDHAALVAMFATVDRIRIPAAVAGYIARIVHASRPEAKVAGVSEYLRYGASPRAAIGIAEAARGWALVDGRPSVGFDDVVAVAPWVLHHRLVLDYRARVERIGSLRLAEALVAAVPAVAHHPPTGVDLG
jgi:MoxR-like ATPase